MFENVKADIRAYSERYQNYGLIKKAFYLIFTQELYPVLIFRFGYLVHKCSLPVVKQAGTFIYFFLNKAIEIIAGAQVWPHSEVGPGLRIEHWGGATFIGGKFGKNLRVQQQVIIGHIGGFKGGGLPTIGDNVYVGAGAKILGEVKIGNNVIIGANAVVIRDIPDNAVAVGVPAKVKKILS